MTDELVEEKVFAEQVVEADDILTVNTDLLKLMTTLTQSTIENNPEGNVADIVYLTVKSVLRHPDVRPNVGSVIPAIFVYYLETHKAVRGVSGLSPQVNTQYTNEAALELFDLYVANWNDHTLRRLIDLSARSFHEVLVSKLSQAKDLDIKVAMGRLSNIALFTETVNIYISSSKRKKNIGYMAWLKTFFAQALASEDLSFMESDETVKFVIRQLINNTKVISTELD